MRRTLLLGSLHAFRPDHAGEYRQLLLVELRHLLRGHKRVGHFLVRATTYTITRVSTLLYLLFSPFTSDESDLSSCCYYDPCSNL